MACHPPGGLLLNDLSMSEWQTMSEPQTQKSAAETSQVHARDTVDLNQRLGNLRPRLLAFARLQLSDRDMAEDVTQEAITAAWQGLAEFRGESQFETWVFGILRFKIIDEIRRRKAFKPISLDEANLADIDGFFKASESWDKASAPASWSEPDQALEQDQFWQVFDICVFHLPENTARVYSLREMIGLETQEICDLLQISEQNCWVILHRARLKLRACLENGWFLKTR